MEINSVTLAAVGTRLEQYPTDFKPEAAFVGRSNVGKSSLINCMTGRKAIARVSKSPGKTRTVNFYGINNDLYLVDLPGYGYAKVSKSQVESWGEMAEGYLLNRLSLKCIVHLIDIRHEPTAGDKTMHTWLSHYGYDIIIAATKYDKIKRSALSKNLSIIRKGLGLTAETPIIPFSSETKDGREALWNEIIKRCFVQ